MGRSMTYATGVLLDALDRGVVYGFSLMDETGLGAGTVYPAMRRMAANGWIDAAWEDAEEAHASGRPARKYYSLTADGRKALEQARVRFPGLAARTTSARGEAIRPVGGDV